MDDDFLPVRKDDTSGKIEAYRERVTKVESQIEIITIKQNQQQSVIDKLTTLMEAINKQITMSEVAATAIRERTDQHTKTIEHLQDREADISSILKGMEFQLSLLRYVGGAILTLIIGYIFSHFIK